MISHKRLIHSIRWYWNLKYCNIKQIKIVSFLVVVSSCIYVTNQLVEAQTVIPVEGVFKQKEIVEENEQINHQELPKLNDKNEKVRFQLLGMAAILYTGFCIYKKARKIDD